MIERQVSGLFRRHVGGRAENDAALRQIRVAGGSAGQPEIEDAHARGEFGIARFEPDIGRLDVAMDQAAFVRRGEAGRHLPPNFESQGRRQRRIVSQPALERLAF